MKNMLKKLIMGDKSNNLDDKRRSRLDQLEEEAMKPIASPKDTPPKKYKTGGMVRRGYGKARGC